MQNKLLPTCKRNGRGSTAFPRTNYNLIFVDANSRRPHSNMPYIYTTTDRSVEAREKNINSLKVRLYPRARSIPFLKAFHGTWRSFCCIFRTAVHLRSLPAPPLPPKGKNANNKNEFKRKNYHPRKKRFLQHPALGFAFAEKTKFVSTIVNKRARVYV